MRDYGKIYTQFWSDPEMQTLPDHARLLALYLLSSEHTNMLGCFRLPSAYATCDLAWSESKFFEALQLLGQADFLSYDPQNSWICIHKFLKWNCLENPNQAKAALKLLHTIPNTSVRPRLIDALLSYGCYFSDAARSEIKSMQKTVTQPIDNPSTTLSIPLPNRFVTVLKHGFIPESGQNSDFRNPIETLSKPYRNQEQEQEQEQKQEQKKEKYMSNDFLSTGKDAIGTSVLALQNTCKCITGTDAHSPMPQPENPLSSPCGENLVLQPPDQEAGETSLEQRAVREIFRYYLEKIERNPKTYTLTAIRKQKGQARLRETLKMADGSLTSATELMKAAVDELAADDWHMGRDAKTNGRRFCDWETHLFGSTERLQKWLELAQQPTGEKRHV